MYNMRYGAGADPLFHVPLPFSGYFKSSETNFRRIKKFICSTDPDIVGLLEVDSGSYRSHKRHQPEEIARALGHYHVYESKYAARSLVQHLPLLNKQGNALLTSERISAQKYHYFSSGIKRLIIEVELSEVVVILVHLSVKFRHRHYQLSELHRLVREANKPVILAGDFNVFWGMKEMDLFLSATGLRNANGSGTPTYPSWSPRRQLDFILHSPDIVIKDFHVPHVRFSDHLPLVCDFEVNSWAA